MPRPKKTDTRGCVLRAVAIGLLCFCTQVKAADVIVEMRNGDRLTGRLITQETNRVVIATSWAESLELPISAIAGLRTAAGEVLISPPPPATVAAAKPAPPPKPAKPPAPAAPTKFWKANFNLGLNLVYGAKDSQLYYGAFKLTYEEPYKSNPKKYFRNIFGFAVNYGETEGAQSANNMGGTVKTDFDVGDQLYIYNSGAVGYDEVRKIDLYYSVGPGVGYHLFTKPKWVMNVESGLSYQVQDRSAGGDVESVFLRLAEDTTWKITDRVSFSHKYEFYQNLESFEQFRFQLNANLSYALWQGISLNLTALDLYDTNPAPGVDKNELQVRSTLGIAF